MRRFSSLALMATALTIISPSFNEKASCVFAQEKTTISEEAQLLYEDALEQQKNAKHDKAIESYIAALRKDRTVLALDDSGLIEASYKSCMRKLNENPNDIKLLETCGFLASVAYSDNLKAITYYEKVYELVEDEGIKQRTLNLIERLRSTTDAQASYNSETASEMRDERIKAWAAQESSENLARERAEASEFADKINEAYSDRENLQNTIPQLEEELKELEEAHKKADRLWYTLKDELYERRRRRLKNDIAAKTEELNKAKNKLRSAESLVKSLEKQDAALREEQSKSAVRKASDETEKESEDSAFNSDPSKPLPEKEMPQSDYNESAGPSEEYEDEYSEEALARQAEEMSDKERKEQLNDLIDEL